jgi:dTDP-glucose 4,6-dehydratase
MKCVITGAKGFVATHLIEHLLKNTDWDIIGFDKMGYASLTTKMIEDIDTYEIYKHRLKFFDIDLNLPVPFGIKAEIGEVDYILHLAAESHVDRSIDDPVPFVMNNVQCTLNILEYARDQKNLKMFVNFSTDEVYGPAPEGHDFKEFEYHHPSNPYAASKSAQEAIGIAYSNTYKVPVITTHTMNIIGERQHPEKYMGKIINSVLKGEELTIHGNKDCTKSGTRFYIHARNLSDALLHIIRLGYKGYDEWNIAGLEELSNLELAERVAKIIGLPLKYKIVDFHSSRPGHDLRYALDSTKLIASGYQYPKTFQESLEKCVKWTLERQEDYL